MTPEVVADADTGGPKGVEVPLVYVDAAGKSQTVTLVVPPAGKWRGSAVEFFYTNRHLAWAKSVLGADGAATLTRLDPTVDELAKFAAEWLNRTGESRGKSGASST